PRVPARCSGSLRSVRSTCGVPEAGPRSHVPVEQHLVVLPPMPAKGYRTAEVKAWREAGGRERNASTRSLAGAQPCDCLDEPGGIDGPEPAGHVVAFRGLEAGDDRGRLGRGSARPRAEEPERVRALLDIDDPA